jgi:NADPH2:quinone reductase
MKAIQIAVAGGPEVLDYVDVPTPSPGAGEVLVRAHAIGVGKPDVLFRTGAYRWRPPLPAIPGAEMSGHIEALGRGVDQLRVGQPVLIYRFSGGCYAEQIAVPAAEVTVLPGGIDLDDAVSIPNYQVAYALLTVAARGLDAKTVYVNGAAGGIGSAIIRLCKLNGVAVIAGASSDEKCAFARAQGASHTVNYAQGGAVPRVLELTGGRGADLILDHIVGKDFTDNLDMLAPMGLIVSFNALGGLPEKDLFKEMRAHLPRSPAVRCFTMHSFDHATHLRGRATDKVLKLFAEKKIDPVLGPSFPLAEAQAAHRALEARGVMGKIILKP